MSDNPGLQKAYLVSDSSIAVARIVTGDTTDTTNSSVVVKLATASTDFPLGITATSTSASDKPATIILSDIAELEVDGNAGAIDINDRLVSNGSGLGVKAATASATAQQVIGYALAPSTASGDVIPILIDRFTFVKGTA